MSIETDKEKFVRLGRKRLKAAFASQPYRGAPSWQDLFTMGEAILQHLVAGLDENEGDEQQGQGAESMSTGLPDLTTTTVDGLTQTDLSPLTTAEGAGLTTSNIESLDTAQLTTLTVTDVGALTQEPVGADSGG